MLYYEISAREIIVRRTDDSAAGEKRFTEIIKAMFPDSDTINIINSHIFSEKAPISED